MELSEIREIVNNELYNTTPFDIILGIGCVIVGYIFMLYISYYTKKLFHWFMAKVFKVRRGKYIKGWLPIKD